MRKARKTGYNTFTELKQIEFQNKHWNRYQKLGRKIPEQNKRHQLRLDGLGPGN
jgi:hypothetical protein